MDAYDRYTKAATAIVSLEEALKIDVRWTTASREYQDALARMAERDWRRALDKLELLMVQRMFELAKTHTFGTGTSLFDYRL